MKKCILIYDDDLDILTVCTIILGNQNYRVETRTRNSNIIDDIGQVNPDVILMDLWIPEIGGEKAIELLKNNKATQHIPIILFSANPEIEEISERTKANGFLKKPFEIATMLHIVETNFLTILENQ